MGNSAEGAGAGAADEAGAVVLFYGDVRNKNMSRQRVLYLEYGAYTEMAEAEIDRWRRSAGAVAGSDRRSRCSTGQGGWRIGETSLLVAVQRRTGRTPFEPSHAYVDLLKEQVPVWKKRSVWGR
jgi:molybdopterin synthase catalytic subunit